MEMDTQLKRNNLEDADSGDAKKSKLDEPIANYSNALIDSDNVMPKVTNNVADGEKVSNVTVTTCDPDKNHDDSISMRSVNEKRSVPDIIVEDISDDEIEDVNMDENSALNGLDSGCDGNIILENKNGLVSSVTVDAMVASECGNENNCDAGAHNKPDVQSETSISSESKDGDNIVAERIADDIKTDVKPADEVNTDETKEDVVSVSAENDSPDKLDNVKMSDKVNSDSSDEKCENLSQDKIDVESDKLKNSTIENVIPEKNSDENTPQSKAADDDGKQVGDSTDVYEDLGKLDKEGASDEQKSDIPEKSEDKCADIVLIDQKKEEESSKKEAEIPKTGEADIIKTVDDIKQKDDEVSTVEEKPSHVSQEDESKSKDIASNDSESKNVESKDVESKDDESKKVESKDTADDAPYNGEKLPECKVVVEPMEQSDAPITDRNDENATSTNETLPNASNSSKLALPDHPDGKKLSKAELSGFMDDTFDVRRTFITMEEPRIITVREMFPLLFTGVQLSMDFHRITKIDVLTSLTEYIKRYGHAVLDLGKCSPSCAGISRRASLVKFENEAKSEYFDTVTFILLIPLLLKEKASELVMEIDEKSQRIDTIGVIQPMLVCTGNIFAETPKLSLIMEEEIVQEFDDFTLAFVALFSSYWVFNMEYPTTLSNTFLFFQKAVVKMKEAVVLPGCVKQFITKVERARKLSSGSSKSRKSSS